VRAGAPGDVVVKPGDKPPEQDRRGAHKRRGRGQRTIPGEGREQLEPRADDRDRQRHAPEVGESGQRRSERHDHDRAERARRAAGGDQDLDQVADLAQVAAGPFGDPRESVVRRVHVYRPLEIDTSSYSGERIVFQIYEYLPATAANLQFVRAAGAAR
jgi:hypothetical protein